MTRSSSFTSAGMCSSSPAISACGTCGIEGPPPSLARARPGSPSCSSLRKDAPRKKETREARRAFVERRLGWTGSAAAAAPWRAVCAARALAASSS